jgi:heavy metal sensor kinase
MFFERILKTRSTLAFRLTLWYAGIFTVISFLAFFLLYFSIKSIIHDRTDRELAIEIAEFASLFATNDRDALINNINIEAEANGVEQMFLRLVTPEGEEITASNKAAWKEVGISAEALKRVEQGAGPVFETARLAERQESVRIAYGVISSGTLLQIVKSLKDDEEFLEIISDIFIITLAVLMFPAALIGWFMAGRALRGVEEVTSTAMEISKGAIDLRVPVKARGDEIEQLATAFNAMLDRIRALISGMREITDNIAHDLRSPVARIRGIAEMTLAEQATVDEHSAMAANTIEECDRLLEMINTMLDIAETEAGAVELRREDVDLAELARDASELFAPLAEDKGVTIVPETGSAVVVAGDRQKLQRMTANLVDNAIKYTPAGGRVTVSVRNGDETVELAVSDTGIGIPEQDLPRIFERFYRGDRSRSRAGSGLGLSLARAIAAVHGGSISVSSSSGLGSIFTVTLPRRRRSS